MRDDCTATTIKKIVDSNRIFSILFSNFANSNYKLAFFSLPLTQSPKVGTIPQSPNHCLLVQYNKNGVINCL